MRLPLRHGPGELAVDLLTVAGRLSKLKLGLQDVRQAPKQTDLLDTQRPFNERALTYGARDDARQHLRALVCNVDENPVGSVLAVRSLATGSGVCARERRLGALSTILLAGRVVFIIFWTRRPVAARLVPTVVLFGLEVVALVVKLDRTIWAVRRPVFAMGGLAVG